ncbi:hypothetical protein CMV_007346 [Castanea mollissima]|uniref:Reverse transcriptase n=1 Tax=Castanea mollissima TaxID=60419 RepID=A0A8J4RF70_9ROSI|nr:hypothetical protein CMV_007346 [Castanea mollissima]
MWKTYPSCKNVVQQAWSNNTMGSRAYQLMHKVKRIRKDFIQWNREVFGILDKEIQQKMKQLQDLQNNITLVTDIAKERMLREQIETLLLREEMMWAQKARSDWILKGDRNTRFFQTIVKQRRARSRIHCINKDDGTPTKDPVEIERVFVDRFKAAYDNSTTNSVESIMEQLNTLPIPQLSDQQCCHLNRPVTIREIEDTVFQLGPHKAPRPDGIPAFLFQQFWPTVKHDICSTVQAFFYSGTMMPFLMKNLSILRAIAVPILKSQLEEIGRLSSN